MISEWVTQKWATQPCGEAVRLRCYEAKSEWLNWATSGSIVSHCNPKCGPFLIYYYWRHVCQPPKDWRETAMVLEWTHAYTEPLVRFPLSVQTLVSFDTVMDHPVQALRERESRWGFEWHKNWQVSALRRCLRPARFITRVTSVAERSADLGK